MQSQPLISGHYLLRYATETSADRDRGFLQNPVSVNILPCICKYPLLCIFPTLIMSVTLSLFNHYIKLYPAFSSLPCSHCPSRLMCTLWYLCINWPNVTRTWSLLPVRLICQSVASRISTSFHSLLSRHLYINWSHERCITRYLNGILILVLVVLLFVV